MRFCDFPVTKKLALGFGAILALVTISSAITSWQVVKLTDFVQVNDVAGDAQHVVDQAHGDLEAARASTRRSVLTGAEQDITKGRSSLEKLHKHIAQMRDILGKSQPALLVGLTAFEEKSDAYTKNVLEPELALSSDPAKRAKAAEMVGSPASTPFSLAADQAVDTLSDKISAWSDDVTARSLEAQMSPSERCSSAAQFRC